MPAAPYEYAVIRYVPRVEREEFVNVGIVVFSKRLRFLDVRYRLDAARLTAFYPEVDLEELTAYLEIWQRICAGDTTAGPIACLDRPERFRWLVAARSTVLQCSATHPGLTEEPDAVLEGLFSRYV
ncbi:MAG: DUF3037 domain-containing protein [Bacteroidota bacterium]